jgi:cellulose synthase/poly-beta-1,6-N-acetylglucosamine synthase-like glycosyltransferase
VTLVLVLVALCFSLMLLLLCSVLFVECLAALLAPTESPGDAVSPGDVQALSPDSMHPSVALLMPAHNEALVLPQTLSILVPQLSANERLLVVADNCSDETAAIARRFGAEVLERQNLERRGKGYALDYGLQFLSSTPPEVVIMVDADCRVELGTIAELVSTTLATRRPVQALYLMEQPQAPQPNTAVSALAFLIKNWVRALGLRQLGFSCLLGGTGMAFPWSVLQEVSLASGNIVEDMQLGLDLAIAGANPYFCPTARVVGILPQQISAAKSQRTRWEHGHLNTIVQQVPRLLKAALQQRRLDLVALALDLSVPPLSLLVLLWLLAAGLSLLTAILKLSSLPLLISMFSGTMVFVAVLVSWYRFGRGFVPASVLLRVPFYILAKLPLYLTFLTNRQGQWVRTQRESVSEPPSQS